MAILPRIERAEHAVAVERDLVVADLLRWLESQGTDVAATVFRVNVANTGREVDQDTVRLLLGGRLDVTDDDRALSERVLADLPGDLVERLERHGEYFSTKGQGHG